MRKAGAHGRTMAPALRGGFANVDPDESAAPGGPRRERRHDGCGNWSPGTVTAAAGHGAAVAPIRELSPSSCKMPAFTLAIYIIKHIDLQTGYGGTGRPTSTGCPGDKRFQ